MAKTKKPEHSFVEDFGEEYVHSPVTLQLKDIKIEPEVFQIRLKMRKDVIKAYKGAYELGADMPPVTVADLKGVYYLVDGFHRVRALIQLHKEYVTACVIPVKNVEEARWIAVKCNSIHGLQLTTKEKINAFDVYIKAKGYLKNGRKGCYKSMREIARELVFWTHVTVGNRLRKYYNPIYRKMNVTPSQYNPEPPEDIKGESNSLTLDDIALGYLQDVYDQLHVLGEEGRRKAKETASEILKRIDEINTQGEAWVYPKHEKMEENEDF